MNKLKSFYVDKLGQSVYNKITKQQFATIALSFLVNNNNVDYDDLKHELLCEIELLKENNIFYR